MVAFRLFYVLRGGYNRSADRRCAQIKQTIV